MGGRQGLERRGDRPRPAQARRGPRPAGRLRAVPLRRAPRDRRPAVRASDHRRPRGSGRRRGGRARRGLAGRGRPCDLRFRPGVRALPVLRGGSREPLRPRHVPRRRPPDHRPHGAPSRRRHRPRSHVPPRNVLRADGGQRGQLHQGRSECRPGEGLLARVRGRHRLGFRRLRGRGHARGRRCDHRDRRHRHQCGAGREAGRGPPDLRHRPRGVQAQSGDRVRRHPHRGVARGGPGHHRRGDCRPHGQQGHHDDGSGQGRHGRGARWPSPPSSGGW